MRDISTQRVPIVVVKFRQILKVRRALRHKSALAKEWHFGVRIEAVFAGELIHIRHELISRNANERVLDLAGDVLGHCYDALLAPAVMVCAAMGTSACAELIALELRLFWNVDSIVAGNLLVATLLVKLTVSEYFTPLVAMMPQSANTLRRVCYDGKEFLQSTAHSTNKKR